MTHFEQIVHALLLSENAKSIGTSPTELGFVEMPGELNSSGWADPGVADSVLHGYRSLRGKYRQGLLRSVQYYDDGDATFQQTLDTVRDLIRQNFIRAFQYGMMFQAGGATQPRRFDIDQIHQEWIIAAASDETRYFENLLADVKHGDSILPWEQRCVLFTQTLDSIFEAGRVSAVPDFVVIHWVVDEQAESCPGCLFLARNSPFARDTLPCTPRDGATPCLSNCKCKLHLETVSAEEYHAVLGTALSRSAILLQLEMIKNREVGARRRRR